MINLERRTFMALLLAGLLQTTVLSPSLAKDGESGGGGGGNSGSGGGGDDGGGGGGGGGDDDGGSDNSGHGGGGDDKGDDRDDDRGDDRDDDDDDQKKARDAVKSGQSARLRDILQVVRKRYKGDVVDVKLRRRGQDLTYKVKMIAKDGRLFDVTVNAATKQIITVSGQ